MNERQDSQGEYLRAAFALNPLDDAASLVRLRQRYLKPSGVVLAELSTEEAGPDERVRWTQALARIRSDFWSSADATLMEQFVEFQRCPHPDLASAAMRLDQVAQHRSEIRALNNEPGVHKVFLSAFSRILVADAIEGNRLREEQHRWMRPEQNEHYQAANASIKKNARLIRERFPYVFALEEAWLTELLEYEPEDEIEDEGSKIAFGCLMLVGIVALIVAIVGVIRWLFF